jgi:hypothetical protein
MMVLDHRREILVHETCMLNGQFSCGHMRELSNTWSLNIQTLRYSDIFFRQLLSGPMLTYQMAVLGKATVVPPIFPHQRGERQTVTPCSSHNINPASLSPNYLP